MIEEVKISDAPGLDDYAAVAHLSRAVEDLKAEANVVLPKLEGRTVWMVNSTAQGGGVAEMLPRMVTTLRELGVDTRWLVINTERTEFFALTKKLHNLIHGAGEPEITADERALYDTVSQELAAELGDRVRREDVLVVHDPQPAGFGALLKQRIGMPAVWRCHIGLDEELPQTREAWKFLRQHIEPYDYAVFTAPEYIPSYLRSRSSIIWPSLDPHSHKNRELSTHKLVGILTDAQLMPAYGPMLTPPFEHPAERLQPDGRFVSASVGEDIGLLFRPIVTQISRWDKLKGWRPLLDGFVKLKTELAERAKRHAGREPRALQLVRLVMAGPEPAAVKDDPEAIEVLEELCEIYKNLDSGVQSDVALLSLPMSSRKENALMVNALQRCSSIVVQNSLREGFGLTATEAMWKRVAVVGSSACGIRQQIRHGIDGHLLADAEDVGAIADALEQVLTDAPQREAYGRAGQRRAMEDFLVFSQLGRWLGVLGNLVEPESRSAWPAARR